MFARDALFGAPLFQWQSYVLFPRRPNFSARKFGKSIADECQQKY